MRHLVRRKLDGHLHKHALGDCDFVRLHNVLSLWQISTKSLLKQINFSFWADHGLVSWKKLVIYFYIYVIYLFLFLPIIMQQTN
jgi:hypothetical protein